MAALKENIVYKKIYGSMKTIHVAMKKQQYRLITKQA